MNNVNDPEEARLINQAKKLEADLWAERVDRLLKSLKNIQKKNGFAPRMALAYQRIEKQ